MKNIIRPNIENSISLDDFQSISNGNRNITVIMFLSNSYYLLSKIDIAGKGGVKYRFIHINNANIISVSEVFNFILDKCAKDYYNPIPNIIDKIFDISTYVQFCYCDTYAEAINYLLTKRT